MYSLSELEKIRDEFGKFSSWALWNFQNEGDVEIIENNRESLHSNYVIIGLNISKKVETWKNFREGIHDRKVKYAFNSVKHIRGAYMTDLIKEVQVDSSVLLNKINNGEIEVKNHVDHLIKEFQAIKITTNSKFIIFGNVARELYDEYFEKHFPENKVYYLKHYSARGEAKKWVENVWKRLNITDLVFENERVKYKTSYDK
jgi:hypothetical protein